MAPIDCPGFDTSKELTMDLSRQEIIDLAHRYIPAEDTVDFPYNGDLFCLLIRPVPIDRVLSEEEGWAFNGYGICLHYTYDEDAKPRGKWLWMHFAGLTSFPPAVQVLKLQPPHIVNGRFQSIDRSHEIRMLKVSLANAPASDDETPPQKGVKGVSPKRKPGVAAKRDDKIVAFRKKKTS